MADGSYSHGKKHGSGQVKEYPTGALPPNDFSWQLGKTAATISLVGVLQTRVNSLPAGEDRNRLELLINDLKAGRKTAEQVAADVGIEKA